MIEKLSESYKNCNVASFSKYGIIPNMIQKKPEKVAYSERNVSEYF